MSLSLFVYLFLGIVGSSHFKISAKEQHVNIIFCVLLYKSPSEILRIFEEADGKAAMKRKQAYERNFFLLTPLCLLLFLVYSSD
jgi:hypothetical protein